MYANDSIGLGLGDKHLVTINCMCRVYVGHVVAYNGMIIRVIHTFVSLYIHFLPPPSLPLGTLAWIERLNWPGLSGFMKAKRSPLYPPSGVATRDTGAFLQSYENFSLFWIMKAGHMVGAVLA